MSDTKYCYPDTDVLINKLDIIIVKTRVQTYRLSDFSKTNEKKILKKIS